MATCGSRETLTFLIRFFQVEVKKLEDESDGRVGRHHGIVELRSLLKRVVDIGTDGEQLPAHLRKERKRILEVGGENGYGAVVI